MKRFVALCLVAVAFATAPAFAGFQEGLNAYAKGDYKTALLEFLPPAEKGSSSAQFYLGLMYENGYGVLQDYKEAVKLYRLSAEQGNADAQNNLGVMYYNGHGILQDYLRAHMWYNIAASNGSENARKNRDIVAEKMTSADINKAQDLASKCLANNYQGC